MRSWTIAVTGGLLVTGFSPVLPTPLSVLCPALVLFLCRCRLCRVLAWFLIGIAVAAAAGWRVQAARFPEACVGQRIALEGVVASLPRRTEMADGTRRQRFELLVTALVPEVCSGPRRVLLSHYGKGVFVPGERWAFKVRMRRPWGLANPGSFNFQAWYLVSGIDALGSITPHASRLLEERAAIGQFANRLRLRISARLQSIGLRPQVSAVLRALVVADKSGIDHHLWSLFQHYGINHLLVISGLHVGMIASVGYLLGGVCGRGLQLLGYRSGPWGELAALVLAGLYTAMAGFSVATVRALVMLSCFMLARIAGRDSAPVINLQLAALAVLLLNPFAGLGSGFWLSFTAVAALLWMGQWLKSRTLFVRLMGVHLFMSALMLPVGGFWFGGSSAVAAPANLLMIPLVGFYVVPLALLGAAAYLVHDPAGEALWRLAAMPLEPLYGAAAHVPGRRWFIHLTPQWGVAGLGLIAVALWVLPLQVRRRLTVLALAVPLLLPPRTRDDGRLLTFLDVGQGTSVVFTDGARTLLYDTGGGNPGGADLAQMVVLPYLRSRGIRRLDAVIISHGDLDHSAGLGSVLAEMPVARLWAGGVGVPHPAASRCQAGKAWQWPGAVVFRFLSPADATGLSSNNASCVLSIEFDGNRVLLAGDIDASQERELIRYWQHQLQSDVLLVGHHGSRTSSTQAWLNRVDPSVAVIGSGYANRFGHPHPEVIARMAHRGVSVRQTAREGALQLVFPAEGGLRITADRSGFQPWWM